MIPITEQTLSRIDPRLEPLLRRCVATTWSEIERSVALAVAAREEEPPDEAGFWRAVGPSEVQRILSFAGPNGLGLAIGAVVAVQAPAAPLARDATLERWQIVAIGQLCAGILTQVRFDGADSPDHLPVDQVRLLLQVTGPGRHYLAADEPAPAVAAARAAVKLHGLDPLKADIEGLLDRLTGSVHHRLSSERAEASRREFTQSLRDLLPAPAKLSRRLPLDDAWAVAFVGQHAANDGDEVEAFVAWALDFEPPKLPSKRWMTEASRRGAQPSVEQAIRRGIELAVATPQAAPTDLLFCATSTTCIKAMVWTVAAIGSGFAGAEPLLGALAERSGVKLPEVGPPAPKIANACVHALAHLGTEASLAALHGLERRFTNRQVLKELAAAQDSVAARLGLTRVQLAESTIPTFDLSGDGVRVLRFDGEGSATISARGTSVDVVWRNGSDDVLKPAQATKLLGAARVKEGKKVAQALRDGLADERFRQEALLTHRHEWSASRWRITYLEHPVAGAVAIGSVWTCFDANGGTSFVVRPAGQLLTVDGNPFSLPDDATVVQWHPVDADPEEVAAWQQWFLVEKVTPPYRQAFRERYCVDPASTRDDRFETRFAGRWLLARHLYALMRSRRWQHTRLGEYDAAVQPSWRPLAGDDLVVGFTLHPNPDTAPDFLSESGVSGDVHFGPRPSGGGYELLPLTDVPPRAFSEGLRDVDLFVSRTAAEMDSQWATDHLELARLHWFIELETVQMRRRILLRTFGGLPHLDGRLSVGERTVEVHTAAGVYTVDIATGWTTDPDNHLVPMRTPRPDGTLTGVPFEDDPVLERIVASVWGLL